MFCLSNREISQIYALVSTSLVVRIRWHAVGQIFNEAFMILSYDLDRSVWRYWGLPEMHKDFPELVIRLLKSGLSPSVGSSYSIDLGRATLGAPEQPPVINRYKVESL